MTSLPASSAAPALAKKNAVPREHLAGPAITKSRHQNVDPPNPIATQL
jgi:hypothetical protein